MKKALLLLLWASPAFAWPFGPVTPGVSARAPMTLTGTSGTALAITSSGSDADNRGLTITQNATGTLVYGLHVLTESSNANLMYGFKVGCHNTGAGGCRAIEASDGDVKLGTQSGIIQINGDLTISPVSAHTDGSAATHLLTLGLGGTTNLMWVEKHNTSPASGATCTSGSGAITAVDNKWSDFTLGSTATFPCVITLATPAPLANAVTCVIVPKVGANEAALSYTTSTSAITLSAGTAGAAYAYFCGGH